MMRVLYIYSHPLKESLHGAIVERGKEAICGAGHELDFLDLHAENFDPVLRADERATYHDESINQRTIGPYLDRLKAADAVIMQFPTWSFGPPAMLKGFVDRVTVPGGAFDISNPKNLKPLLTNINHIIGIVTYGQPRWMAWWMRNPSKVFVTQLMRFYAGPGTKVEYHALYHINTASRPRCEKFIERIAERLGRL